MSSFAERLKTMRKSHGLTQQALADKVGCSGAAIGLYENGKREPDLDTIETIADALNVPLESLVAPEVTDDTDELEQLREELRRRPEMHTLFSLTRKCSTKEVLQAIRVLEALHDAQEDD